jgi:putative phage-type endonuclease
MIFGEITQRTPEWYEQRRGKFTASNIYKLMGQKGLGKTGQSYIEEKVAESLGATIPQASTYAMQRGIELEPEAIDAYCNKYDATVILQPFRIPKWCNQAGCSPDGIVKFKFRPLRGLEIKCPYNPVTHVENLFIDTQDKFKAERPEYYWQVQMCMAVTNRKYWDWVSYHPDFPVRHRIHRLTIRADPVDINLLRTRIREAVKIKKTILKMLK